MRSSEPAYREPDNERRLPGDAAVWMFVLGDMVIFAFYFAAFLFDRRKSAGLFVQSQQHLSQNIGFVNTLILLTSSLFVALGVDAARRRHGDRALRLLAIGGGCGLAFVLLKSIEWSMEATAGYTFGLNAFFMYYYALTGVHLLHVLMGLGWLLLIGRELRNRPEPDTRFVEAGAIYWHMVDLLWIVLFALLYLMR